MNSSRCKRITLIDFFYLYSFKKNILSKLGTIPTPFIKHSECTDTSNSVNWYEYKEIILLYLDKLKLYMENGNSIELGTKLGEVRLTKFKANRFIDKVKSKKEGRVVKMMRNNVDNYFIAGDWKRGMVRLKMKSFWKIQLNKVWLRKIYLACEKDYTKIYKIRDSK